jgi:hypothetical protein
MKTNFKNTALVIAMTIAMGSCSKDDSIFNEASQNETQKEASARAEAAAEVEESLIKKTYCGASSCSGHLGESVCRSTNLIQESAKGDFKGHYDIKQNKKI